MTETTRGALHKRVEAHFRERVGLYSPQEDTRVFLKLVADAVREEARKYNGGIDGYQVATWLENGGTWIALAPTSDKRSTESSAPREGET